MRKEPTQHRKTICTSDGTTVYDGIRTDTTVYETYQTKDKTETKDKTKTNSLPPNGVSDTRAARFTPPTIDDVTAYVSEKGYHVNAERFVSFYQQKGWMVGKNRMKDWKAAVRNWETRWKDDHGAVKKASGNVFLEMLEERQ